MAALAVLLGGLTFGGIVYFTAGDETEAAGYVVVGDQVFATDPADSRVYRRELQRFGGKALVLFDDFLRWFGSRWRGRQLGVTVACLSAAVALALVVVAHYLEPQDNGK